MSKEIEEWVSSELKSKEFKKYFSKSRKSKHTDYLERRVAELYGNIFHEVVLTGNIDLTKTELFLKYNTKLKKLKKIDHNGS